MSARIYKLVVIGASLGGGQALSVLLAGLPAGFPVPVAVVQHRHKDRDGTLQKQLQAHSALPVREVEDKIAVQPGCVYLAPADYHLLIEQGSFALSTDAPVVSARPSIDVLFEAAADSYNARVIGVVLTGASHDGAAGLAAITRRGGVALVQDPATAECSVMPTAALAATPTAQLLPLAQIAPYIVSLCQDSVR